MKRILILICCIGLLGAARGQTKLYYWFDTDSVVESSIILNSVNSLVTDINVSGLTEGIHKLNIMVEDVTGKQSPSISNIFYRSSKIGKDLYYRCWFDDDEQNVQSGELGNGAIMLDVSGLTDGLHKVNVQAYSNFVTAPKSSIFLKIPQVAGSDQLTFVCLIDDILYEQQTVSGKQEIIHINLDVAPLSQGIHKIQVMLATESGAVTSSYTTYFYRVVLQSEINVSEMMYAIDGKSMPPVTATTAVDGKLHFDIDVSSLPDGLHSINYAMIGGTGVYGISSMNWFYKIPLGGEGIVGYDYWQNDRESELRHVDLAESVSTYQLVSLLPVEKNPIRSNQFKFAYQNDTIPVVYAKNDFHVRFWEKGGRFALAEAQYVDERVCDTIIADTLREVNTISKPAADEIHWFKVKVRRGDSISLRASTACTIQMFSPSGKEEFVAEPIQSIKTSGLHPKEDGIYYIALHDVPSPTVSTVKLYSEHIDKYAVLRQNVSVMGDAGLNTIVYDGNGFDSLKSVCFVHGETMLTSYEIGHESNTLTSITFSCLDAIHGEYDAIFYFGEGEQIIKKNNIVIQEASPIILSARLDNDYRHLRGTESSFTYTITNNGNMTAYNIPLTIMVSTDLGSVGDILVDGIDMPSLADSFIEALEKDSVELTDEDKDEVQEELHGVPHNHVFYPVKVACPERPTHTEKPKSNDGLRTVTTIWIAPNTSRKITVRTATQGNVSCSFNAPEKKEIPPVVLIERNNKVIPEYIYIYDDGTPPEGEQSDNNSGESGESTISSQRPSWFCCHHRAIEDGLNVVGLLGFPASCVMGIASAVTAEVASLTCDNVAPLTLGDRVSSWGGAALGCLSGGLCRLAGRQILPRTVCSLLGLGSDLADMTSDIMSIESIATHVTQGSECDNQERCGSSIEVTSFDPNEITGYTSESGSRYMRQEIKTVNYKIEFDNDTVFATAPAHTVVIRDTLDATRFDLTSFVATEVTIGDRKMNWETPQGGSQTLDLRTIMNVVAQVSLNYDQINGIAEWTISSLDPMTMEPITDPDLGVLPVNFDGNGQGTVSFRIGLKDKFDDGTQIADRAEIIFDTNAPLLTPLWVNTVDAYKPKSRIEAVEIKDDSLHFHFSASDNRSGVWQYSLYARTDSEHDWELAVQSDMDTCLVPMDSDWTQFYVIATDSAGNEEIKNNVVEYSLDGGLVVYHTVTVNSEHCSVSGSGSYVDGTTVILNVTPDECYRFIGWSDSNTDNPRTIVIEDDVELTAFTEMLRYKVNTQTDSPVKGSTQVTFLE